MWFLRLMLWLTSLIPLRELVVTVSTINNSGLIYHASSEVLERKGYKVQLAENSDNSDI